MMSQCTEMMYKTKGLIVDFRETQSTHMPLNINDSMVETVNTMFLGVHISNDFNWTTNTTSITKKAQQRLHFLRCLKQANLPPPILTGFYRGTIESILTRCIFIWFRSASAAYWNSLQRIVEAAGNIWSAKTKFPPGGSRPWTYAEAGA